jgi:hypothetical protein
MDNTKYIYCRGAWKKKVVGGKELVAAGKRKSTVGSDAAESGTKRHDDVESVSSVAVLYSLNVYLCSLYNFILLKISTSTGISVFRKAGGGSGASTEDQRIPL